MTVPLDAPRTSVPFVPIKLKSMSVNDELIALKKTTACYMYLDELGDYLDEINDSIVRCGCDRCTDKMGSNYPKEEENRGVPTPDPCWKPGYWVCSKGQMTHVPISQCLLYQWFKDKCKEYKCIVPDDTIDHPQLYPRSCCLHWCLGNLQCGHDAATVKKRWRFKIKALSYQVQVDTIYRLLYYMDVEALVEEGFDAGQTFEQWFTIKGHSLLP